jgi:hypothetical protein
MHLKTILWIRVRASNSHFSMVSMRKQGILDPVPSAVSKVSVKLAPQSGGSVVPDANKSASLGPK